MLPGLGAVASLAILVCDSIGNVGNDAVGLATATLIVAGVRLTLTVRKAQTVNDERQQAMTDRQAVLLKVLNEVARNAEMLTAASERLTTTATRLSSGADQASSQADVVANASRLIGASTQSVAAGAEQMTASIAEIARNAADAAMAGAEAMRETEQRTRRSAGWPSRRQPSGTWSRSSPRSPSRPTFSRSTRRSRRPAPVKPVAASQWWPVR